MVRRVPEMFGLLHHPTVGVRARAIDALAVVQQEMPNLTEQIEAKIVQLINDPHEHVRKRAAEAIESIQHAKSVQATYADDSSLRRRRVKDHVTRLDQSWAEKARDAAEAALAGAELAAERAEKAVALSARTSVVAVLLIQHIQEAGVTLSLDELTWVAQEVAQEIQDNSFTVKDTCKAVIEKQGMLKQGFEDFTSAEEVERKERDAQLNEEAAKVAGDATSMQEVKLDIDSMLKMDVETIDVSSLKSQLELVEQIETLGKSPIDETTKKKAIGLKAHAIKVQSAIVHEKYEHAHRVHVLSTRFSPKRNFNAASAVKTCVQAASLTRSMCYNPNTDNLILFSGDKQAANNSWLEMWLTMLKRARDRRGYVLQIFDGSSGKLSSMQVAEHQIANSMNVRMLRIHVPDGSQTEDAHGLVELLSKSISSSILVADLISPPIAKVDSALLRKTLEKPTMSEEVDEGLLREAREVLRRSEEPPAASKAPVKDSFWRVAARTQMQPSESLPGAEQAGTSRNASSMVLSNLRSESDLRQVEEMRVSLTAALSDLQFKISDEEQRATAVEDALSARLLAAETKQAEVAARPAEEIRQLGQASEGGDEDSIDQATEGGDEDNIDGGRGSLV